MKKEITKRQRNLLSIIYHYIKDVGYPPTFEEMRKRLGVSSNQSVIDLLEKLKEARCINREGREARSIVILPLGYKTLGKFPLVPFFGITSAGMPIEAIELSGEWQQVSSDIARFSGEVFLLKISGDSMINAGIEDGDIVLVKEQKEFISGEIVLAQVSDEYTIKRFVSEDKPPYIYLKPENPDYQVIPFTDEMELKGKIISVFKNGYWKQVK